MGTSPIAVRGPFRTTEADIDAIGSLRLVSIINHTTSWVRRKSPRDTSLDFPFKGSTNACESK